MTERMYRDFLFDLAGVLVEWRVEALCMTLSFFLPAKGSPQSLKHKSQLPCTPGSPQYCLASNATWRQSQCGTCCWNPN